MKIDYSQIAIRAIILYVLFWCFVFIQFALGLDLFPENLEGFAGAGVACFSVIVVGLFIIAILSEFSTISKALRRISETLK